ncbi:MAG: Periplasmic (Fe) hydrogenase large subunit [Firmicutes bacterium ADurb.Bin146]|nr:MAG: Periplasmic (Fe) hydrogenase large subunit [Firmicutes bacterium ADurb.Bin146]
MTEFLRFKQSNCKNCYKCIRHCPVKSIRFSGNQAHIIGDECILCGQCFVVCPQNAKEIADNTEKAKVLIASGHKVIASIAPSFIANYNGIGIKSLEKGLKKLGFYAVEETAIGAKLVKDKYDEMLKEGNRDIIITSCCHSVNLLIQKHHPKVLPYLADVLSPMQAHSLDIKKRYPDSITIFIGPCLAKMDEAERYTGITDCVLTFDDLTQWLEKEKIELEKDIDETQNSKTRLFPTTGGILKTMLCEQDNYTYIAIDGIENCKAALKDIEEGGLHKCFIEMSACTGSCIGGPVMEKHHAIPIKGYKEVTKYAGKSDYSVQKLTDDQMQKSHLPIVLKQEYPSENEIVNILAQMGKFKKEDELNCGSCGYDSCREKAIAVFQGKADYSMCLPFLQARTQSFSDTIIGNTPNGIFVLNESFEVQQINKSALSLMNIRSASDVLGEPVIRILDPKDFINVRNSGNAIRDKKVYLAEYEKYVEMTIIYDREYKIILCIMRDVTEEYKIKEKKEAVNKKTVETADKVVEKQMRVVQEIASLLGETVAETKIALTKLKETISDE